MKHLTCINNDSETGINNLTICHNLEGNNGKQGLYYLLDTTICNNCKDYEKVKN